MQKYLKFGNTNRSFSANLIAKTLVFKSLIAVLVLSVAVFSAPVSLEKALHVAENASKSKKLKLKHKSTHKKQRTQRTIEQTEEEPLLYVFQKDENKGFVLIAGDDVFSPIIGISENGTYDSLNMPPNFAWYLENIQEGMANALENEQTQTPKIANEWLAYADGNSYEPGTYLIKTKWGQGEPFNNETPTGTVTGCAATTMAQIMNYHQHPINAIGTIPAYITRTNKLEIEATELDEVVFDWANMKEEYASYSSEEANAVATLMSVVSKSIETDYSTSSSAYTKDVATALKGYFSYNYATERILRSNYSNSNDWISILKEQVNLNLPVFYAGTGASGGHAFILDGYDNDGKFHINWGWNGQSDGFYTIAIDNSGSLNPPGYNFSSSQEATINIKPRTDNSVPPQNSDIINLILYENLDYSYIPITLTQTNGVQISNKTLNYDSKFIVKTSTVSNTFSTQDFYGKIAVVLEKEDGSDAEILTEKYVGFPIYSEFYSLPTEFYITKINAISGNYQISIKYTLDGQNYSNVPVTEGWIEDTETNFIFIESDYQPLKGITVIGPNLSNITIKSQPTKSTYIHGEVLDLSGMVLTLEYENSMIKEVPFSDFEKYGITTDPENFTELDIFEHNSKPITVIYDNDNQISTNNLTINKASQIAPAPTMASRTSTSITLNEIFGAEYRLSEEGTWQGEVEFTNLLANTVYTFYARLKETATHEASPVSEASEISTSPIIYTVTFIDHDETELKTEEVEHGSSATAPEDPTRTGYTFDGWDTEFYEVTDHLTVTATYIDDLTSINPPQAAFGNIIIQSITGGILLQNLPSNTKIQLFNLQGKQVYLGNSGNSKILQILIQTKGIYIVKVGAKTFKIVK